jgi:tungstate transport system permease protein
LDLLEEYRDQLRSLGASSAEMVTTLLWDGRYRLITAVLAGFGRAIAEVGAVIIVGGDIDHVTRTMHGNCARDIETKYCPCLPLRLSSMWP